MKPLLIAAPLSLLLYGQALAGQTVQPTTIIDYKAVAGSIQGHRETQIRARIPGTLVRLLVQEGDAVKAGQLLALVQDGKVTAQLNEADGQVKALEAQQKQAAAELKRVAALRASGATSARQLEQAQAQAGALTGQLAAARAARARAADMVRDGHMTAPVAGRILQVEAVRGNYVQPGEPVLSIATAERVVRIALPEGHAHDLKAGQRVTVRQDGDAAAEQGRVALVYPEIVNGRVQVDVTVPTIESFFVGERAEVEVPVGRHQGFEVPADYVTRKGGLYYVRLKDGSDIPVQPGADHDGMVEILTGLVAGDELVKP